MIERRSIVTPRVLAFTLIELVAALALATLITIAVLAVMHSMVGGMQSIVTTRNVGETDRRLADLLRFDLQQASAIRQSDGVLMLAGYSGLDPATLAPTHRPVLVSYTRQSIADRLWLVRQQTALDVLSTTGSWSEPIAIASGVPIVSAEATVPIVPLQSLATDPQDTANQQIVDKTPYVFARLGMRPMPDAVHVRLAVRDQSPMDFTVFVR